MPKDCPTPNAPGSDGPWRISVCAKCGAIYSPALDHYGTKHQWTTIDVVRAGQMQEPGA